MIRKAEYPSARILVVDDNPMDSALIAQTLRLAGYSSVTVLNDPRLAAAEYRAQPYDLVLLDLNMPHLDGFDVLDRLREVDRDSYLPVLVMTAQNDRAVRLRVLEHGAKDFLAKPYDLQEVLNRISNMLEVRLLHNQVREQNRNLERKEADLRTILETAIEGIITIDEAGLIESFNQAAERMFGYTASEVIGLNVGILMPGSIAKLHDHYVQRYLKSNETFVVGKMSREVRAITKSGKEFDLELSVNEVHRGDKRVFVGMCRDITERKLAEQALRAAKDELEQAVTARTRELIEANKRLQEEIEVRKRTEHDLEHARDKALEASKLKSQFLANVSHEVRTPLNGMLGMLSLMINGPLTEDQDDHARTAMKSGETLLSLINDLLDFAKVESGRLELENIAYDLRQIVLDVVHLFEEQSAKKNLDVITLISPQIPGSVIGDPARIRQVITNLIGNAIKFTEQGEVVISLDLIASDEQTSTVRFTVRDTGVGIKRSALNRIFDSFTQADGSTTRRFGGTGLGLAICKQLVELMSGSLHVESEENVGSTFWFTVPQRIHRDAVSVEEPPVRFGDLRAVVVTDHPSSIEAILGYLTAEEIKFEVVPQSHEVLPKIRDAKAQGRPVSLVIFDHVRTPLIDADLVKALTQAADGIRIMILGSTGLRGEGRSARDAGVSAYLTLPVELQEFRRCMQIMFAADGGQQWVTRHVLAEQAAQFSVRVLVVEDNPVNQKVAVKMLTKLGARVDVVVNGRAAVEAAVAGSYDLILMDCLMPDLDGYDATRMIRAQEKATYPLRHVPIVAMTANASDEDRNRCLAVGMDDFLAKPVTFEIVTRLLYKWAGTNRKSAAQTF